LSLERDSDLLEDDDNTAIEILKTGKSLAGTEEPNEGWAEEVSRKMNFKQKFFVYFLRLISRRRRVLFTNLRKLTGRRQKKQRRRRKLGRVRRRKDLDRIFHQNK